MNRAFLIDKAAPEEVRRKALEKVVALELTPRETSGEPVVPGVEPDPAWAGWGLAAAGAGMMFAALGVAGGDPGTVLAAACSPAGSRSSSRSCTTSSRSRRALLMTL